jgi:hypothetical protein
MKVPKRRIANPQAPQQATYHRGPILTNGALEFVYEKPVLWPLFTMWGDGIRTLSQINSVQAPQLDYNLALTTAPVYGAGVPAGSTNFQGLEDDSQ